MSTAPTKTTSTPEEVAAHKAAKKKAKTEKKLHKLEKVLAAAGPGKEFRISDLNHVELVKALKDLEDGIGRIRKLLEHDRA